MCCFHRWRVPNESFALASMVLWLPGYVRLCFDYEVCVVGKMAEYVWVGLVGYRYGRRRRFLFTSILLYHKLSYCDFVLCYD